MFILENTRITRKPAIERNRVVYDGEKKYEFN